MQTVTTIGLDIDKSVFQVHGVDAPGQVVIRRRGKSAISHSRHTLRWIARSNQEQGDILPACQSARVRYNSAITL